MNPEAMLQKEGRQQGLIQGSHVGFTKVYEKISLQQEMSGTVTNRRLKQGDYQVRQQDMTRGKAVLTKGISVFGTQALEVPPGFNP